jgi:DNA polymerase-4
VKGGMPGRRARELCPQLIFVGGHFKEYARLGDAAMKVLDDFTPLVERISIDEAFRRRRGLHASLRLAGRDRPEDPPAREERAGLPISVGVARTKHLAKIASQVAKPDGLVVVDPEKELAFLHGLPVELMWGVGPVTRQRLAERGVTTIGQLANTSPHALDRLLGPAAGEKLLALAWNRDPREIRTHHRAKSAGAQSALGRRPAVERVYRPALAHLADRIGTRLRAKSLAGRTVTVRVRFADLRAVTRSLTLDAPIAATASLAEIAEELARTALADHPQEKHISSWRSRYPISRSIPRLQLEFSLGARHDERRAGTRRGLARHAADRAVDRIRDRFGWEAIGYGSVACSDLTGPVHDEFRGRACGKGVVSAA